jgi:hypothetical protein
MLPRNMTIHLSIPFAVRLAVVVLLLGGTTARVWANAGPRSTSTKVVAEPVGIRNVRIDRETLTIDLRPLETGTFGIVEAVYHLQNDGPAQTLDLLFAFGTQTNSDFRVTFNDRPIAGNAVKQRMPDEWLPPRVTPGLTGSDALEYGAGWSTVLPQSFSIDVPVGPSVLAVRYRAEVKHTYALPAMYREFAYILAPARAWAGFGGLDVTIHPPPHWTVAVSPALPRDGDLLRGHFDAIPADAIGMTLRPPVAAGYQRSKATLWGAFAVISIAGLLLCRRWSVSPTSGARHLFRSAALGMAYGIVVFATAALASRAPDLMYPPTAAERALIDRLRLTDGYATLGTLAVLVLASGAAAVTGCVAAQVRGTPGSGPQNSQFAGRELPTDD